MAETFRSSLRPTIGREKNMKTSKNLIAGLALFSGLLAFATSASADWGHPRNDLHRDRQELSAARRELHNDIRRGAGRAGNSWRPRCDFPRTRGIFGRIDESGETIVGTITTTDAVMVGGTAGKLTVVSLKT